MQYICVCDELAGDVPRPCLLGLLTLSRAAADTDTAGDIVLADTPLLLRWAFGYPPCGFLRGGAEVEVEPGSFLQLTAGETAQTAQTVTPLRWTAGGTGERRCVRRGTTTRGGGTHVARGLMGRGSSTSARLAAHSGLCNPGSAKV